MRRYDDPVETRMGQVAGTEGPEQFLWRGRLWKVRAVIAHWVETGPWWQSGGARAVIGSDEAAPGGTRTVAARTHEPAGPFSLPATTHSYLARAAESLRDAMVARDVPTRYACAHVAGLRAAAALLAARARPASS